MTSTQNQISDLSGFLQNLGFTLVDGQSGVFAKQYQDGNQITADVKHGLINYGTIKVQRKTTSNFKQGENLVVLECINRLLEKGYSSSDIELEKTWMLGRKQKGYLDIFVTKNGKAFLMIECKTWEEYDKAKIDTQSSDKSGGQIFSYLQQEPKNTAAILYYTSREDNGIFIYKNAIIFNKPDWAGLNQDDRFNNWSKVYESKGIFDENAKPYAVAYEGLKIKELMPLSAHDSNAIYNQFAEILRHNVVSDKPNAFSKIINLFLCKITDESGDEDDICKFHTITNGRPKTNEELFEDLNDLYKKGMENYLKKSISDFTQQEFKELEVAINDKTKKQLIEEMYVTLRLYKNNEFAFKEVFDKSSFEDNAKVVREVVEMLQGLKLRYTHKQQFLGDFFEKLLNDSIKQESGQFFTPTPIAEFMIRSLPFKECIQHKLAAKEINPLPYVIDYACGTGHFLTEVMDYLNGIIKNEIDEKSLWKDIRKRFAYWKDSDFEWASEYIYGIDLDYRLTKSTKINCFLNGDGEASIIHADGLAPFSCDSYSGILHDPQAKELEKFDFVISNPPYAVRAFAKTLSRDDIFELQSELTEKSSDIQCLFIERAKQLLKIGGFMSLVLPQSILFAQGINLKSREMLLKHFCIKAIIVLGPKTFMATGVNTCVIVAQKRQTSFYDRAEQSVDRFFSDYQDVAAVGINEAFSVYVNYVYPGLAFSDYVLLLRGEKPQNDLPDEFSFLGKQKDLKKSERPKLIYFLLSFSQKIVLGNSAGDGSENREEVFLGYTFSNRRGQEGIQLKRVKGQLETLMFSADRFDDKCLSSYILRNCLGQDLTNDIKSLKDKEAPLSPHIEYCCLSDLLSFRDDKFSLNIKTKLPPPELNRRYHRRSLDYAVSTVISGKRPEGGVGYLSEGVISLGGENIERDSGFLNLRAPEYIDEAFFSKNKLEQVQKNDILICKDGALTGKCALVRDELSGKTAAVNEHVFILRSNSDRCLQLYLFYYLKSRLGQSYLKYQKTGTAQGGINASNIRKVQISLPPINVQEEIIHELLKTDSEITLLKREIKDLDDTVKSRFVEVQQESTEKKTDLVTMSDVSINLDYKRIPIAQVRRNQGEYPYYGASGIVDYIDDYIFDETLLLVSEDGANLLARTSPIAFTVQGKTWVNNHAHVLKFSDDNLRVYVEFLINMMDIKQYVTGSAQPKLTQDNLNKISFYLPNIQALKDFAELNWQVDKLKSEKQNQILKLSRKYDEVIERFLL